jgi:DNA-binding PadR family transcriptional regulator
MKRLVKPPEPLSQPAVHVLLALGADAKHGYAIMRDIAAASDGQIRMLPGTLYSTIKKLLNSGMIEEVDPPRNADSDDARRRYYRVTAQGKAAVDAETRRMAMLIRLAGVFRS